MNEGTVCFLKLESGFGFIRTPRRAKDTFFHMKELIGLDFDETLIEQRVVFDIVETPKGPQAVNIRAAK